MRHMRNAVLDALALGTIDPAAIGQIFSEIQESCSYNKGSGFGFGVNKGSGGYFNLRQIGYAIMNASRASASARSRASSPRRISNQSQRARS